MVFQNYALYPHLTVFENIAFPLRLARGKFSEQEVRERVNRASDMLELKDHLERKPANLSGGQRQRVAMGRAIVRQADAFLFDEPLSNLDAKLRGQMRTEISRMQRRLGTTTVYVTHDQTEAMTLGDRVAVLKRGILQQVGSPRELYDQPVNIFVAGFIGSPPMNFLPGRVDGTTLHLPIGDVDVCPESHRKAAEGKDLVIAGIRPEHFEDASVLDSARRGDGGGPSRHRRHRVARQRALRLRARSRPTPRSRSSSRSSTATSTARACARRLVVALDAMSRVRDGDRGTLSFDPRRMPAVRAGLRR